MLECVEIIWQLACLRIQCLHVAIVKHTCYIFFHCKSWLYGTRLERRDSSRWQVSIIEMLMLQLLFLIWHQRNLLKKWGIIGFMISGELLGEKKNDAKFIVGEPNKTYITEHWVALPGGRLHPPPPAPNCVSECSFKLVHLQVPLQCRNCHFWDLKLKFHTGELNQF